MNNNNANVLAAIDRLTKEIADWASDLHNRREWIGTHKFNTNKDRLHAEHVAAEMERVIVGKSIQLAKLKGLA